KSACKYRTEPAKRWMGFHARSFTELASAHVDLAHDRCPILRARSMVAAFCECASAQHRRALVVPVAAQSDTEPLAKRFRRCVVRNPSAARGISRVGSRTQRCSQRLVLHACAARLRALREGSVDMALPNDSAIPNVRFDVEADAGDDTGYSNAHGLLAAREMA